MKRHNRDNYMVVGEGILTLDSNDNPITVRPSAIAEVRKFRFSRLGDIGKEIDDTRRQIFEQLAEAMTTDPDGGQPDGEIPAGYTYLSQFVDHDMTKDVTDSQLGQDVTVDELVQGRSPALDLDSLYGRGPGKDPQFYSRDGLHIKTGTTSGVTAGPGADNPAARLPHQGFDLPRVGVGSTKAQQRLANIPDQRNDENLAVAQTHLAFIRFHNAVVDQLAETTPSAMLFGAARNTVVKHYQWMLRTDFLPRIVQPEIVDDVFTNGRKLFEVPATYTSDEISWYPTYGDRCVEPGDMPTMPIEFSVAAYRLGHSMVRGAYNWNAVFDQGRGSLLLLFAFSGTSGILAPGFTVDQLNDPDAGALVLPSNWIADFRRLYDFSEADRADLTVEPDKFNVTKRIDTLLVNPLSELPLGSFGGRDAAVRATGRQLNLAFRNLTRGGMLQLANGQQMAKQLDVEPLSKDQIINGAGGASLAGLADDQKNDLAQDTPLWFYILREAELGDGRLTGVGGRIVAEVFHRAMEGSRASIVRDPDWRPSLGPKGDENTFRMVDLLLFAFDGKKKLLAPLG